MVTNRGLQGEKESKKRCYSDIHPWKISNFLKRFMNQ